MNAVSSFSGSRRNTDRLHGWVPELFRIFCRELDVLVYFAQTGQMQSGQARRAREQGVEADSDRPAVISRRLQDLFGRLEYEAGQRIGFQAQRMFDEVRYALVALADEMLLAVDWPGRKQWTREPLELRLFGSQKAGQEIYERIQLRLAGTTSEDRELALVYLMMLALGFRGQHLGQSGQRKIAALKDQLFAYYFHRTPDAELGRRNLVPEAYRNVLSEGSARNLPYLRPWNLVALVIVLIFVAVGHGFWSFHTTGLDSLITHLVKAAS